MIALITVCFYSCYSPVSPSGLVIELLKNPIGAVEVMAPPTARPVLVLVLENGFGGREVFVKGLKRLVVVVVVSC